MKIKFRFPDMFFGMLLAVAIFAMGAAVFSSRHQPADSKPQQQTTQVETAHKPKPFTLDWLTHDGVVFFTFVLSGIAGIQAVLFIWQLRLIKIGTKDAAAAANAANTSAEAAQVQARIMERTFRALNVLTSISSAYTDFRQ